MAKNSNFYQWEILAEYPREIKIIWRVTISTEWSHYWLSLVVEERITKIINKVDIKKFGDDHSLIRIFIKEEYRYFIQD